MAQWFPELLKTDYPPEWVFIWHQRPFVLYYKGVLMFLR